MNNNEPITQPELKMVCDYDESSGAFTLKKQISKNGKKIFTASNGYLTVRLFDKMYSVHRLVWLFVHGKFPDNVIDHIDGDKFNNAISNLRDVTNSINLRNKCKHKRSNTGYVGIHKRKDNGQYQVKFQTEPYKTIIKCFKNLEDAIEYKRANALKNGYKL